MYRTAWPILWCGRRDEILRNPGWFGSWKRLCLDNLRKLLLDAVKGMHVKHVKVLTEKLHAKDRRILFRRVQGKTVLHQAVRLQVVNPSPKKLEIVRVLLATRHRHGAPVRAQRGTPAPAPRACARTTRHASTCNGATVE